MGAKPKQSDYKPSQAEITNTKVAVAQREKFVEKYDPILLEQATAAATEDLGSYAAGKKQADTYQVLGKPSMAAARSVDYAADLATAASDQILRGRAAGEQTKANRSLSTLASAQGQQMDATTGIGALARLGNAGTLASAERKLLNRQANLDAGALLAGSLYQTGKTNKAAGGGFFGQGLDRSTGLPKGTSPDAENPGPTFGDRFMGGLFG